MEAAIAAGVLLPEQVEALRRRGPTLGEKPTIWEVRIGKGGPGIDANSKGLDDEYDMDTKGGDKDDEENDWANVMVCLRFRLERETSIDSLHKSTFPFPLLPVTIFP